MRSLIVIALTAVVLTGCGNGATDVVSSKTVRQVLEDMGYVVPGLPSGQYSPGTIVTVRDGKLVPQGKADQCIVDENQDELLEEAEPVAIAIEGTINRSRGWDANAFIEAYGLSAGPRFNQVRTADLRIGGAQVESLVRPLALSDYLWAKRSELSPACSQAITNPDRTRLYVVTNAIGAAEYHYVFSGEAGAGIDIDASNLADFFGGMQDVRFVGRGGVSFTSRDGSDLTASGKVFLGYQEGLAVTPADESGAIPSADTLEAEVKRQQELLGM